MVPLHKYRKGSHYLSWLECVGFYLGEVLDLAAALPHALLKAATPDKAEAVVVSTLEQDLVTLGEDARGVMVIVLGKCFQG